jgi:hypothetical protein
MIGLVLVLLAVAMTGQPHDLGLSQTIKIPGGTRQTVVAK